MFRTISLFGTAAALSACVIVVDGGPEPASLETEFAQGRSEVLAAEATLAPFDGISAAAGTEVIVRAGDAYTISLDDDARRRSTYEVDDGTLSVTCRKRRSWGGNCVRGDRGTAIVTVPGVASLRASSGAELRVSEGVALEDDLALAASSGATLNARDVSGAVASLTAKVSSGASLDARGISARTATASASSGASLRLGSIEEALTASASSGASVRYDGDPEVTRSVSSGGSVSGR